MGTEEIGAGTIVADTYEVTRLLGQGGMGQVWEAQHRRLVGKRVAVKILLAQAAADPNSYARFRREAEIASRLGHPNIVEALDFNTLPSGTPYIILEFLKGESLAKRLQSGPMQLDATLAIVRQVASALAAAHKEGVVHRDLKPDNIYLCPTDSGGTVTEHVKVLDFGISKIKDSNTVQTQASSLIGTPQYMSPEQASGKHTETDHRTDQFALGAIVFEMLIGQAVFAGQSLAEVITKVLFAETPLDQLAGRAPDHVIAAVGRALSKSSADRFPDIGQFIAALTGRPLQTLDRAAVPSPGEMMPFQPTGLAVDPMGGTVAPGQSAAADAFASTSASQGMPVVVPPPSLVKPASIIKPLSNPSLAAGEVGVPQPTAQVAPTPSAAGSSKLPLVLGGTIGLFGVAALLFVALQKKPTTTTAPPETSKPVAAATKEPEKPAAPKPEPGPTVVTAPKPEPNPTPTPAPKPEPGPTVATAPKPEASPTPTATPEPGGKKPAHAGPPTAPKEVVLSPEAEKLAQEAESLIAGGKYHEAQRLAEKSLDKQDSVRARSLIARSACGQHNQERAYVHKSKIAKGSAGEWKKVQAFCKKFELEVN